MEKRNKSVHEDFAAALCWSVLKLVELGSRFPGAKSVPRSCNPEFAGRDDSVPQEEAGGSRMGSPSGQAQCGWRGLIRLMSLQNDSLLGVHFLSLTIEL